MDWFKTPTNLGNDPQLQAAGASAAWVWQLARCYIAETESGGWIPATQIARFGVRGIKRIVQVLLKEGLWVAAENGYQDARWVDDQSEFEALAHRRAADRERQRKHRALAAQQPPHGPTGSGEPLVPEAEVDVFGAANGCDSVANENDFVADFVTEMPSLRVIDGGGGQQRPVTSRDMSRDMSRDVTPPEKRREENPPHPPPSGGSRHASPTRCSRHRARPKTWCADCQLLPIARPDALPVAAVLAVDAPIVAAAEHGAYQAARQALRRKPA